MHTAALRALKTPPCLSVLFWLHLQTCAAGSFAQHGLRLYVEISEFQCAKTASRRDFFLVCLRELLQKYVLKKTRLAHVCFISFSSDVLGKKVAVWMLSGGLAALSTCLVPGSFFFLYQLVLRIMRYLHKNICMSRTPCSLLACQISYRALKSQYTTDILYLALVGTALLAVNYSSKVCTRWPSAQLCHSWELRRHKWSYYFCCKK